MHTQEQIEMTVADLKALVQQEIAELRQIKRANHPSRRLFGRRDWLALGTRLGLTLLLAVALLWSWVGELGQVDSVAAAPVQSAMNPLQVALLRWYDGHQNLTFDVAAGEMAFDGLHLWVTNPTANTVQKLNPRDGTVIATYDVGAGPAGIAYDGASIWVANQAANTVQKLQVSSGRILGTYSYLGINKPTGLAYDGANIWVTNNGHDTVTKLRASDGQVLGQFRTDEGPMGIAFDGQYIWVANNRGNSVTVLQASDGELLLPERQWLIATAPVGVAMTSDGIAVTNSGSNTVTRFQIVMRQAEPYNFEMSSVTVGNNPWGIAFDGQYTWVANSGDHTVTRLGGSTRTFAVGGKGSTPKAIVFDGANIWVANGQNKTISKL